MTDEDRQQRALASLSRLTASPSSSGVWTPAWSSHVLEKTIASILSAENAKVGDVLRALWQLAGRNDVTLTAPMANFIRDIVVLCFTRYRTLYDSDDLAWMAEGIRGQATPSQAYLALLALPEDLAQISRTGILDSLRGSEYLAEAQTMLA